MSKSVKIGELLVVFTVIAYTRHTARRGAVNTFMLNFYINSFSRALCNPPHFSTKALDKNCLCIDLFDNLCYNENINVPCCAINS